MKDSWMIALDSRTGELSTFQEQATLEVLRRFGSGAGTGFVELIRPHRGVEVYCDEDGRTRGLKHSCVIAMKRGKLTHLQSLLGPVLFVFPRAKSAGDALARLVNVLVEITPEEGESRKGPWTH